MIKNLKVGDKVLFLVNYNWEIKKWAAVVEGINPLQLSVVFDDGYKHLFNVEKRSYKFISKEISNGTN